MLGNYASGVSSITTTEHLCIIQLINRLHSVFHFFVPQQFASFALSCLIVQLKSIKQTKTERL